MLLLAQNLFVGNGLEAVYEVWHRLRRGLELRKRFPQNTFTRKEIDMSDIEKQMKDGRMLLCAASLFEAIHAAGGKIPAAELTEMSVSQLLGVLGNNNIHFKYVGRTDAKLDAPEQNEVNETKEDAKKDEEELITWVVACEPMSNNPNKGWLYLGVDYEWYKNIADAAEFGTYMGAKNELNRIEISERPSGRYKKPRVLRIK